MAFDINSQLSVAFKKLVGKAQTDSAKGFSNEAKPTGITSLFSTIVGEGLPAAPSTTALYDISNDPETGNPVVEYVRLELVADPSSNGHAFFAKLPSDYETNSSNPEAGNGVFVNDQVLVDSAGQLQIVPVLAGLPYEVKPYTGTLGSGTLIPPGDPRDWYFDYFNGVFFQQDIGVTPTYIECFIYIGKMASESAGTPDDITIEKINGILQVKDAGISDAKLKAGTTFEWVDHIVHLLPLQSLSVQNMNIAERQLGQSVQVDIPLAADRTVAKVYCMLSRAGGSDQTIVMDIRADSGGEPGTVLATSEEVPILELTDNPAAGAYTGFVFSTPFVMSNLTTYWFVLRWGESDGIDISNTFKIWRSTDVSDGTYAFSQSEPEVWSNFNGQTEMLILNANSSAFKLTKTGVDGLLSDSLLGGTAVRRFEEPATFLDQTSITTSSGDIPVDGTAFGDEITPAEDGYLDSITLRMRALDGGDTGDYKIYVYDVDADANIGSVTPIPNLGMSTSYHLEEFTFATPVFVEAGKSYRLMFYKDGGTQRGQIYVTTTAFGEEAYKRDPATSGTWTIYNDRAYSMKVEGRVAISDKIIRTKSDGLFSSDLIPIDDITLEDAGSFIQVKDGGVSEDKLATDVVQELTAILGDSEVIDATGSSQQVNQTTFEWVAQTILINKNTKLKEVLFDMYSGSARTGNIYCEVYESPGLYPTGSPIATSDAFDSSTLETSSGTKNTFIFSGVNQIDLEAGKKYGFAVVGTSVSGSFNLNCATSNVYPDGVACYSADGSSWTGLSFDIDCTVRGDIPVEGFVKTSEDGKIDGTLYDKGYTTVLPAGTYTGGTYEGTVICEGALTFNTETTVGGDLIVKGNLTLSNHLTVKGNLFVEGSITARTYNITVGGNLKSRSVINLSSNVEGEYGGNLTVEGDIHAYYNGAYQHIYTYGYNNTTIASAPHGGNIKCAGDLYANIVDTKGGTNTAGNGGNGGGVTVGGSCYIFTKMDCYGGDCNGVGNGGVGGAVNIGGNFTAWQGINCKGGLGGSSGTGGSGGNSGNISIQGSVTHSQSGLSFFITCRGGNARGTGNNNGGSAGQLRVYGACNIPISVIYIIAGTATGSGSEGIIAGNVEFQGGLNAQTLYFQGNTSTIRYLYFAGDSHLESLDIDSGFEIRAVGNGKVTKLLVHDYVGSRPLYSPTGVEQIPQAVDDAPYVFDGTTWVEYPTGKTLIYSGSNTLPSSLNNNILGSSLTVENTGTVQMTGNVTVNGNFTISGPFIIRGNLIVAGTIYTNGQNLTVYGDVLAVGTIDTRKTDSNSGSLTISGNLTANSIYTNISSSPTDTYTGGNIDINGNAVINGNIVTDGSTGGTAGNGGNAGHVWCKGNLTAIGISTKGGNAGSGTGAGGEGGWINIGGNLTLSSTCYTYGGNASGTNAIGRNGGAITVKGNFITNSGISTYGGSAASGFTGNGGDGGTLTVGGDLLTKYNSVSVNGGTAYNATGGDSGGIIVDGKVEASSVYSNGGSQTGTGTKGEALSVEIRGGCSINNLNFTGEESTPTVVRLGGRCTINQLTVGSSTSSSYKIRGFQNVVTELYVRTYIGNNNLYEYLSTTPQLAAVFLTEYFYNGNGNTWELKTYDEWRTLVVAAATGGGTNYTTVNREEVITDTATNNDSMTVTLPSSPKVGWKIRIIDGVDDWATNNVTVARNGSNINGVASDLTLNVDGSNIELIYMNSAQGWRTIT